MTNTYETEPLLRQYLDFHFRGGDKDYLPHHPLPEGVMDYPVRCAEKVIQHTKRKQRALDLGCAVGGSTFALASTFRNVVGIDYSHAFINTANEITSRGSFILKDEIYRLPHHVKKGSVSFEQGNACSLREDLGTFDAVLMANLLCRLPDPALCLIGLQSITKKGSVLVFMTPCSWDAEYTPREKWLWPTEGALHEHLDPWCTHLETTEMPFVLRDHERRAQFTVALCTAWQVK